MFLGEPKASPVTVATWAFSRRNKEKSVESFISNPSIVLPKK